MTNTNSGPLLIAVASGKGGVGKSLCATNLALLAAQHGKRVVILDADFGGANVHNFLGLSYPPTTLDDFLVSSDTSLAKFAIPALIPNFWFISGDRASFELANMSYQQKLRLLRHLRKLPVDLVFLDLGAGSSFNTLDFFNAADQQLLITLPNQMSVDNMYHFLKTTIYRRLKFGLKNLPNKDAILQELDSSARHGDSSFADILVNSVDASNSGWKLALSLLDQLQPRIVLNQLISAKHATVGTKISIECEKYFGLSTSCVGLLPKNKEVERSVLQRTPIALTKSVTNNAFLHELERIYYQITNAS